MEFHILFMTMFRPFMFDIQVFIASGFQWVITDTTSSDCISRFVQRTTTRSIPGILYTARLPSCVRIEHGETHKCDTTSLLDSLQRCPTTWPILFPVSDTHCTHSSLLISFPSPAETLSLFCSRHSRIDLSSTGRI